MQSLRTVVSPLSRGVYTTLLRSSAGKLQQKAAAGSSFSQQKRGFSSVQNEEPIERDRMDYDILIVGAGPAGLSAAIQAKKIAKAQGKDVSVCVVEKGAEVGAHILSGNVFEPRALNELIPNWREKGAPLDTPVKHDRFYFLGEKNALELPEFLLPKQLHNEGNYIISLGNLCKWLAAQAEEMGVEIFPGFSAANPILNEQGGVCGIQIQDVGLGKGGERKDTFQPGMELRAKQTILSEGARGSISEVVMSMYNLRSECPQQYGLGIKEVWEIDPAKHRPGLVVHSVGWPLSHDVYGGSFMYHMAPNLLLMGMVVGLDYKNPYLSPYQEFQRWKTHPHISPLLEGGRCISYGARVLNEGGVQALPKLTFPGGMLTGCSAGFLNVPKIKGTHLAMKTGMLAGETAAKRLMSDQAVSDGEELHEYAQSVQSSWAWQELHKTRNAKPAFKWGGLAGGMAYSGFTLKVTHGKEPWTFRWSKKDSESTQPARMHKKIEYPKPDGKITFDILENLARSGTNHDHDQPSHLKVKPALAHVPLDVSLPVYAAPESRFCPAKVYEYLPDESKPPLPTGEPQMRLQINAQNCVHCKCCDIKPPMNFIQWTVPEGGGGPAYSGM